MPSPRPLMIASALALPLMALAGAAVLTSPASALALTLAAPEPEPVPRRWELQIEAQPLRVAYAQVPGVGTRPFYYLTFKATNVTGKEQTLAVSFELSTGDGNVFRAGRGVPVEVTKQIIEHVGNPLLQDPIGILGPIQHGRENAREGIVIWPLEDFTPEALIVYAAGFSGETATIELPKVTAPAPDTTIAPTPAATGDAAAAKPDAKPTEPAAGAAATAGKADAAPAAPAAATKTNKDDANKAILRKTKVFEFKVPGEVTNLRDAAIPLLSERWIMR